MEETPDCVIAGGFVHYLQKDILRSPREGRILDPFVNTAKE